MQRYPWYVFARVVLLKKLAQLGRECFESGVRSSFIYLPNRKTILRRILSEIPSSNAPVHEIDSARSSIFRESMPSFIDSSQESVPEPTVKSAKDTVIEETDDIDFNIVMEEIMRSPANTPVSKPGNPKPYILGGDYFSAEDFKDLEKEKSASRRDEQLDFKYTAQPDEIDDEQKKDGLFFEDIGLYTETLAKIYAQQGYYQQAIEVYSKLCLLYPEKSAYFASLVQEIKLKK